MRITEDKGEKITKEMFKVTMATNFLKLRTDTKTQISEPEKTPSKINTKRSSLGQTYSHQRKNHKEKVVKEIGGEGNREKRMRMKLNISLKKESAGKGKIRSDHVFFHLN